MSLLTHKVISHGASDGAEYLYKFVVGSTHIRAVKIDVVENDGKFTMHCSLDRQGPPHCYRATSVQAANDATSAGSDEQRSAPGPKGGRYQCRVAGMHFLVRGKGMLRGGEIRGRDDQARGATRIAANVDLGRGVERAEVDEI